MSTGNFLTEHEFATILDTTGDPERIAALEAAGWSRSAVKDNLWCHPDHNPPGAALTTHHTLYAAFRALHQVVI